MYICKNHGEVQGQEAHYKCVDCGWQLKTCALCDDELTDKQFNASFLADHKFPTAIQCNACGSEKTLEKLA